MAKIFRMKWEPVVNDLTIPEISDKAQGWLMVARTSKGLDGFDLVHEGDASVLKFPSSRDGIRTYNLQSCTCIVYLIRGDLGYDGAWLYHAKGGYMSNRPPLPWQIKGMMQRRPQDYEVAIAAWEESDEYEPFVQYLEQNKIPSDNIVACLRPYNGFETFAVTTSGTVGEPMGKPSISIEIDSSDNIGLISGQDQSNTNSGWGWCPKCPSCFITTATCSTLGLPDDNTWLNTLRWYRDEILLKSPQGREDVATYYVMAPKIVTAIEQVHRPMDIYIRIFEESLKPAVRAIHAGRHDQAYRLYKNMVNQLADRYLNRC